jgi:ABC-type uncharacterized transport system permease subunit
VIPIAFLASIPAQIVLQKSGPLILIWGLCVGGLLLKLSTVVWARGLRVYGSASS